MRLSVAANYDPGIAGELAESSVEEVFGKLASDFVGGGRPSYICTPVGKVSLAEYVRELAAHKIKFNYLLNSACMGNKEWSAKWQKNLMGMLEWLSEIGVTRLTVSTPYLLELIKARRPEFYVRVGIFAQVDTPTRAMFWENLGADAITLESFSINRDFQALGSIRKSVKCDLQLIANHICLWNCPMQCYHQNGISHSSDNSGGVFFDYCLFNCALERISDGTQMVRSRWIRPEDISEYEAIGFTNFKILERGMPSSVMVQRVRAYSGRKFEGNLAEIFFSYGFKKATKQQRLWYLKYFFKPWLFKIRHITEFFKMARQQGMGFAIDRMPIVIDSSKIPADFLERFKGQNCNDRDCADCGHCSKIAKEAVTIDNEFKKEAIERMSKIDSLLVEGKLWI